MAIDKLKRKKGFKYRVRILMPSGKRVSKIFSRRVDADKFEAEIRAGLRTEDKTEEIFFFELCEKYEHLHLSTLEFSTQQKSSGLIKKYLLPRFGDTLVNRITRIDASLFLAEVHKMKLSNAMKSNIFATFQSLMRRAVDWGYIAKSPSIGLKIPRRGQSRMMYWSPKEIQSFLEFHRDSQRLPLYLIALNTGMRQGEILGLCWDCIDLDNDLLVVRRTWCQKTKALKDDTKSHRVRTVGINSSLRECLLNLRKIRTKGFVLLPEEIGCSNSAHVSRIFRKDCEAAGVRSICFHDLRHTFATQFVTKGGTIHALSGILGHTSEAMTARYAHFGTEHAKAAAKIVNFGIQEHSNVVPLRKV